MNRIANAISRLKDKYPDQDNIPRPTLPIAKGPMPAGKKPQIGLGGTTPMVTKRPTLGEIGSIETDNDGKLIGLRPKPKAPVVAVPR